MSSEQTSYVGDDIKVLVNVIDSTGSHVAATINTSTTRLNGFSTVPTVNTIGTGIYEIVFASVTPSPAEGDRLIAKINGDIGGTAWTEYAVPIKIVADERGTDSVVVPTSDITAIKAKTDQLAFTVANQVDANSLTGGTSPADIYTYFTTGTNEDAFKADTSTLATSAALSGVETKIDTIDTNVDSILVDTGTDIPASIAALNNFDPATDQVIVSTNNDKTGYALSSAANDAIGSAFLAYTLTKGTAGTIERAFWQSLKAGQLTDGSVSGTPTASEFDTDLTAVSGAFDHLLLLFTTGSLAGEARPVSTYNSTNGRIVLQDPLTSAPSSGDEFIIVPDHTTPTSEIVEAIFSEPQSGYTTAGTFGYYLDAQVSSAGGGDVSAIADAVWDEQRSGHLTAGTFGYYLDARVSQVSGGSGASAADIWGALLVDYATPGSFGARFQEADRYTNTSANIRYINQGDSYDGEANPVLSWSVTKDYTSYSLTMEITHRVTGEVLLSKAIAATDSTTIEASLSSTDTAFADLTTAADFGAHRYLIKATLGSSVDSAVIGAVVITET